MGTPSKGGILQQMSENGKVVEYGHLTKDSLMSAISDVVNRPLVKERKIMMYTGEAGYRVFNWMVLFGDTIQAKHFHHDFKRLKGVIYVSLFRKHGPFKVKVKDNVFYFYKGTQLIHIIDNVRNQWEKSDAFENIEETKTRMVLVNQYIDLLSTKDGD